MPDEEEKAERRRSNLLMPVLSLAFAIVLQTVFFAYFMGRLTERVDTLSGSLSGLRGDMGLTVDQRVQSEVMRKEVERLAQELRLLKDFTEGRISHLPYRRSIKIGETEEP